MPKVSKVSQGACQDKLQGLGLFDTPEACAAAAAADATCSSAPNSLIMWSPNYHDSWSCKCCGSDEVKDNTNWELYSHGEECETPRPSPAPAATGTCEDDAAWLNKDKPSRTCAWVAQNPAARCNKKDPSGTPAWIACPDSCPNRCGGAA